ncbi:hypothetical protein [Burkholderia cenocepacia]|uniref:hypothetical protein n=1 Tax=Burkholderia cenocepacia TaxID=95486 RepID=UPI000981B303|nr:hypothetical protein [Burkholderia cenocepacia]ONP13369.1 hypothetical protein A8D76_02870 [Burkholderia cenocepacia]ONU22130.1 hypothetical protein A8E50_04470 [Burkholderia cenocepacia]ONW97922.1 hypothetical protein A8F09_29270 [Burkholderia cenocepacia]ONX23897.1 hypothetical protein A8F03_07360 [Burkholderia cenocepacia]
MQDPSFVEKMAHIKQSFANLRARREPRPAEGTPASGAALQAARHEGMVDARRQVGEVVSAEVASQAAGVAKQLAEQVEIAVQEQVQARRAAHAAQDEVQRHAVREAEQDAQRQAAQEIQRRTEQEAQRQADQEVRLQIEQAAQQPIHARVAAAERADPMGVDVLIERLTQVDLNMREAAGQMEVDELAKRLEWLRERSPERNASGPKVRQPPLAAD